MRRLIAVKEETMGRMKRTVACAALAAGMALVPTFPALAGPPGPPGTNPPPAGGIACLVAAFAGPGLVLSGQFTVSDDGAGTLTVSLANGATVTATYLDGDGDGFHCDDVQTGTDTILSITVNA